MTAMRPSIPKDFDEYAERFPLPVQQRLRQMRKTIRRAAPGAQEKISYGMPAFTQNGMLVWFAAHQNHIGLYPRASAIKAFKKELSPYKSAKGSVQLPFDRPLPLALVGRMVKFRVKENQEKKK